MFLKVFLLTSRFRGALTQRVLLRRLRAHVILSVIWLLWSLFTQLFLISTNSPRIVSFLPPMQVLNRQSINTIINFVIIYNYRGDILRNSLIGLMIASTFCQDVVHCLVVSNYCIECQLLLSYVRSISERVMEKSLTLDVAMKVTLSHTY